MKKAKMTPEERAELNKKLKEERLAQKVARKEELKERLEEEKARRKEEREKVSHFKIYRLLFRCRKMLDKVDYA